MLDNEFQATYHPLGLKRLSLGLTMANFIVLNKEQEAYIEVLKSKSEVFGKDSRLIGVPELIESARLSIIHAVDIGLPLQAYIDLQNYVSMYDRDQRLPEHLRRDWSKFT
ncbi:hypothetical protein FPV16_06945 [Methylobacterium sp. W2]|uniref:hypothetical protein n=1 Tax=Methylobacterium sp. W2 TaxID=2598107 RepID=UPI001D0C6234|nr:hypothetical protein [Methylobacterium sp. W2]MCC0805962.1 hypothetical protein [Methylobacterium sp. W2]